MKDSLVHGQCEARKFLGKFRRDLTNRAEGTVAETKRLFHEEKITDELLEQRVRTAVGRVVSHPHAIEVKCKDGVIELSGWVMTWELNDLRHTIQSIRGVRDLSTFLHTAENAEHISALQGGERRKRLAGFLGAQWPPTGRAIAATAGVGLLATGLMRRKSILSLRGLAGMALLMRSAFNMPLRYVGAAELHVEKTLRILASRDDLWAFWVNPENYAKVFSHVKQVTREGEGVYRWHVAGPGGMPLSWTGTITRQIPGRLIEWKSLPGSAVENHGVVRLDDEGNGYTRVHVQMGYVPPAGLLGHAFATLLGIDPRSAMHHDFVQLKSVLEQGVTHAHGQRVEVVDLGISSSRAS